MIRSSINVPNLLTVSRLLLVPCFFVCLYYDYQGVEETTVPLRILLMFIVISDFLDGYLARRWNTTTRLGRILDPLADKFFVVTSYILLTAFKQIPPWLTILVVSKDVMILLGWSSLALLYHRTDVNPTWLGKSATAAQFVCVVLVVMLPPGDWLYWVFGVTGTLTVLALADYMIQLLLIDRIPTATQDDD